MTADLPLNVSQVRLRMFHSDRITAIYHGRIFDLFEEARTEAFRRCGFEYRERRPPNRRAGIGACERHDAAFLAAGAKMTKLRQRRCPHVGGTIVQR